MKHPAASSRAFLPQEMFTPSQQPVLDQWSAGELSEKEFLRQVDWYSTWKIDFALYRDLLLFCRDQGIKILALNAEPETRQLLSRTAIEDLSVEDQARLPEMDFDDPHYRTMLNAFMTGHPMGHGNMSGFERVQTLWDETMAASPGGTGMFDPGRRLMRERQQQVITKESLHLFLQCMGCCRLAATKRARHSPTPLYSYA